MLWLVVNTLLASELPGAHAARRVLLVGGTGRIGTACAAHLLTRDPTLRVVLAGRDDARGRAAIDEVRAASGGSASFAKLDYASPALAQELATGGYDAVCHVAGPFDGPLDEALSGV